MKLLETAAWLLPSGWLKTKLLRFFGHHISNSARIGPVLALNLEHVSIADGCRINRFNTFRSLRTLTMGEGSMIGQWNTITAFAGFKELDPFAGSLVMGRGACITSRHYVDCSGGLEMGEMSALYGHRTTLLTHEIDMSINEQTAAKVVIGERSAVLTNCVVLKGAHVPPKSIVAAHSTVTKARQAMPESGLYAGTPARCIGPVPSGTASWFERDTSATTRLRIDSPIEISPALPDTDEK